MSIFDSLKTALIGTTSATAGSIVDSLSNGIAKFVNTPEDKAKADEFTANMKQAIQAELDKHTETMQGLYEQAATAQIADVQNARDMEIKLNQAASAGWMSKNINPILAFFVSIIWGGVTAYLLFRIMGLIAANPNVNMTALMSFYTAITAMETIILSFYFGSSKSSQAKDDTIATIAKSN